MHTIIIKQGGEVVAKYEGEENPIHNITNTATEIHCKKTDPPPRKIKVWDVYVPKSKEEHCPKQWCVVICHAPSADKYYLRWDDGTTHAWSHAGIRNELIFLYNIRDDYEGMAEPLEIKSPTGSVFGAISLGHGRVRLGWRAWYEFSKDEFDSIIKKLRRLCETARREQCESKNT